MKCFGCPNSKKIIHHIQKADKDVNGDNQVYIEVYHQKPQQEFQNIVQSRKQDKSIHDSNSNSPTGVMIPLSEFKKNNSVGDVRTSLENNVLLRNEKELLSKIEDYKQIVLKYKKTMHSMNETNEKQAVEIQKYLEQIVGHNVEIDKFKNEVKIAKEKVKEYEKESIALNKQMELLKISLDKKEARIIELHVDSSKCADISFEKSTQITALQNQLSQTNETFQKLQTSLNDITQLYNNKKQECNDLTAKVNQMTFTNQEIKTAYNVLQGKYDEIKSQIETKNDKMTDLNDIIKTHKTEIASYQDEINKYKQLYENLKQEFNIKIVEKDASIMRTLETVEQLKRMFPE